MATAGFIFISNDDSLVRGDGEPSVSEEDKVIYYKILSTGIESLYEIITGKRSAVLEEVYTDGAFVEGTYDIISEFTTWTFEFKPEFIDVLKDIEEKDISLIVDSWRQSPDCPYSNEKDVFTLLHALHRLSVRAYKNNMKMYFRMEL